MKLILLSILFRTVLIIIRTNLLVTFYFSSRSHSLWIFFRRSCRSSLILLYFFIYLSVNIFLLLSIFQVKLFLLFYSQSTIRIIYWLIISGIPPFSMFWLKVNVVLWIKFYSVIIIFYILILSVFSLRGYYFSFHLRKSNFRNIKKTIRILFIVFLIFSAFCY